MGNYAVCADAYIVTDADAADDFRACADIHIVADDRRAGIFGTGKGVRADGHLLENGAIGTDHSAVGDANAVKTVGEIGFSLKFRPKGDGSAGISQGLFVQIQRIQA